MVRRPGRSPAPPEAKRTRSVFVRLTEEQHERLSQMARDLHLTLPYLFELSVWGADTKSGRELSPLEVKMFWRVLVNTRTNLEQLEPYVSGADLEAVQTAKVQLQQRIDTLDEILACFTGQRLHFKGFPPKTSDHSNS